MDVLGLHEFDSVRKRMSVVIRFPDGSVKVFAKGADSSMFSILAKTDGGLLMSIRRSTDHHLVDYSSMGLRTLVVGGKDLSGPEFMEWQSIYEDASTSLHDRAAKLRVAAAMIERDLNLLGATGIEDKLQEGVPEAIESLRQAGIKVWVLTGDKQETAISIGLSCKLLTPNMQQIIVNGTSEEECRQLLADAKSKCIKPANVSNSCLEIKNLHDRENFYPLADGSVAAEGSQFSVSALIIDGNSLVYILEKKLEQEACTLHPISFFLCYFGGI